MSLSTVSPSVAIGPSAIVPSIHPSSSFGWTEQLGGINMHDGEDTPLLYWPLVPYLEYVLTIALSDVLHAYPAQGQGPLPKLQRTNTHARERSNRVLDYLWKFLLYPSLAHLGLCYVHSARQEYSYCR